VTLAGLAYGQTVLARAVQAAGFEWNSDKAHSAVYDTERTADLFCTIINRWNEFNLNQPDSPAAVTHTERNHANVST
jgi:ribonuclease T